MLKKTTIAALLATLAFPAYADTDHSTIMGCYASVQTQCYGNGANNCSDEVYQGGLDECDSSYGRGSSAEIQTHRPGAFGNFRFGAVSQPMHRDRR